MDSSKDSFELSFLVKAEKWADVIRIFKDDIGITKDKKDASDHKMIGHYIVKILLTSDELTDAFYQKIFSSAAVTILSDEASAFRGQKIMKLTTPVEIKLRSLLIYAHELVDTYFEIVRPKNSTAKAVLDAKKLVGDNMHDAAISFLDMGEIIAILNSAGNDVETKSLSDDIVALLDRASDFESFKKDFGARFKRLTVWDVIAKAVLQQPIAWNTVKGNLELIKSRRNQAAHFRVITPGQLEEVSNIVDEMLPNLSKKQSPAKYDLDEMAKTFEDWSKIMEASNKAFAETLKSIQTTSLAQALEIGKMSSTLGRNLILPTPILSSLTLDTKLPPSIWGGSQTNGLGKFDNHEEKPKGADDENREEDDEGDTTGAMIPANSN